MIGGIHAAESSHGLYGPLDAAGLYVRLHWPSPKQGIHGAPTWRYPSTDAN